MIDFRQDNDGDWRAYANPFDFWIFEAFDDQSVSIYWKLGDESGSKEGFDSVDKAKRWCYQFVLDRLLAMKNALHQPGARIHFDGFHFVAKCEGRDRDMGYVCDLPPSHSGPCYCVNKRVEFNGIITSY